MMATTKIYNKYQTVIPVEIRKKLNITKDHVIEWDMDENNDVKIHFRRKRDIDELEGLITIKEKSNSKDKIKEQYK